VLPIWLLWKLRTHWKWNPRPILSTLGWIAAGIAAGVLMAFSARIIIWFQDARSFALLPVSISARDLLLNVLYQTANAALNEEPVFRAILWGYLARLNWPPLRILVFQAALFGFAHLDAALFGSWVTPLIAFLYGLVFGWLVWRSKTIVPSIIAHGITNGIGTFLR
jgi:membrane protease YdiL (CAAX protease family)